jgi:hypothetical protein
MNTKGAMRNPFLKAEAFFHEAQSKKQVTRFQAVEYYNEFFKQETGHSLPPEFDTSSPKDFLRKWNGAKRASVLAYKRKQAELAKVHQTLEDVMPIELLIRQQMAKL